ncbi:alpha-1,3-mannosyl-glycoprotein 4-beta-N-acetylglucosaminyltransferase A-like [Lingula anatina]|uniref:Alpha-1,3-mannosyl-glycoprotein 4-beta-N-acetylglucosaminyltransferase A-like n=1 Tax=Lingula anatina TaxID=7574 RepID=A0A2R2MJI3_LINAN|nr:alpha-1,3-mannosyl-glycoprotein 4-beta-N-acetylglucosaminyltransferase A-like [Lingula anatina]|eukprot:XP_023930358.1 alpha-1,3-mannosyl-glycoprotein 4-beta-N-acetylglucosaminyltransferase A-like [Lingula anatina]
MGEVLLFDSHENPPAIGMPVAHKLGVDVPQHKEYVFGILASDPPIGIVQTLASILKHVAMEDREKIGIIVLLTTMSDSARQNIEMEMVKHFSEEIQMGMMEIVTAHPTIYEINMKGQSDRSVLSCAYLMQYSHQRGDFYIHLDDTVIATRRLFPAIESFLRSVQHNYWISIDFSTMAIVGQLFRSSEILHVAEFFISSNASSSPDRLLQLYVDSQQPPCHIAKNRPVQRHCFQELGLSRVLHRPSLFTHNKNLTKSRNNLAENEFPNLPLTYEPWPWDDVPIYINPPAKLSTSLRHHHNHSLERAYRYLDYFYAIQPKAGDMIYYNFTPPVVLEEFFIQCGSKEHPWIKFSTSTYVDILPLLPDRINLTNAPFFNYGFLDDGYVKVARFDNRGKAEGPLGERFGKIVSVRIRITTDHGDWVPVRHMSFKLQLIPSGRRPCCEPYWPDPFPGGIPGVRNVRD